MKNKLSVIFYMTFGFLVGYLLDTLRQNSQPIPFAVDESQNADAVRIAPESPVSNMSVASVNQAHSADFLQVINGIGPAYAQRLFESGIRSLSALAQTDSGELAKISKVRSQSQVEGWIKQAAELLNK